MTENVNLEFNGGAIKIDECPKNKITSWTGDEKNWLIKSYIACDDEKMLKDMRERLGKLKGKDGKLFINENAIKEILWFNESVDPKIKNDVMVKRLILAGYSLENILVSKWMNESYILEGLLLLHNNDYKKVLEAIDFMKSDRKVQYIKILKELVKNMNKSITLQELIDLGIDIKLLRYEILDTRETYHLNTFESWNSTNTDKATVYLFFQRDLKNLVDNGKLTLSELSKTTYPVAKIIASNIYSSIKELNDLGYTDENIINAIYNYSGNDSIFHIVRFILHCDKECLKNENVKKKLSSIVRKTRLINLYQKPNEKNKLGKLDGYIIEDLNNKEEIEEKRQKLVNKIMRRLFANKVVLRKEFSSDKFWMDKLPAQIKKAKSTGSDSEASTEEKVIVKDVKEVKEVLKDVKEVTEVVKVAEVLAQGGNYKINYSM